MQPDRKKPGVALWATVVVVVAPIIALAVFVAWQSSWQSVSVPEIARESEVVLVPRRGAGWPMDSVSTVHIWVTGQIDGDAEIWADGWSRQKLAGKVDYRVGHDWFDPVCRLHYEPHGVTAGNLTIRYRFD